MGWRKKITLTEKWRQATGCIRERARRKGWELRDTVGEPSEVKSTYYKQISSKHPRKIPSSQLVLQERIIQNEVYRIGFNWEQRARNQSSIQDEQGGGGGGGADTGYCGPFLPPFHPSLCICLALGKNMSLCNTYKQTNAFTGTLFLWRFTLQVQRRQFSPMISYLLYQNISSTWHLGRNVYLPLFSIYLLSFHRKYHTILDICSTR